MKWIINLCHDTKASSEGEKYYINAYKNGKVVNATTHLFSKEIKVKPVVGNQIHHGNAIYQIKKVEQITAFGDDNHYMIFV
ncbi:MAG: hypothetical protein ACK4TA_00120 [Saprospiraceae bacterium]